MAQQKEFNLGGSIFWIIIIFLALGAMLYLGIWSFHNNSVKGLAIASIFSVMIMFGLIFSKFEIFNSGGWGDNCLAFMLGLIVWNILQIIIGFSAGLQSTFSLTQTALLSTISSDLPQLLELLLNGILVPVAEELVWIVGIPFTVIAVATQAATLDKRLRWLDDKFVQLMLIAVISVPTFALFHVGKLVFGFLIGAMVFRTITILSVFGDKFFDTIKFVAVLPAAALGMHIGSNLYTYGYGKATSLLAANFGSVGWIVFALFIAIALSGANKFFLLLKGRGESKRGVPA